MSSGDGLARAGGFAATLFLAVASALGQASEPRVTREDLARTFQRLDEALVLADLSPEELARASLDFDRATEHFFRLDLRSAIDDLERLRYSLLDDPAPWSEVGLLTALRIHDTRPTCLEAEPPRPVRLESARVVPALAGGSFGVTLRLVDGPDLLREWPIRIRVGSDGRYAEYTCDEVRRFDPASGTRSEIEATHWLELVGSDGIVHNRARCRTGRRVALFESMGYLLGGTGFGATKAELAESTDVYDVRFGLLELDPSPERSIEFLTDPTAHVRELERERDALEAGRDPYRRRPGHLWRPVFHKRSELALRIYAPDRIADGERLPLVVALHGAGADENFFPEARGVANLIELADRHGFLVACPFTPDYFYNVGAFESVVETVARSYDVDRERVFVVGHSLGGVTISGLLRAGLDSVAKACCISGAIGFGGETPVLVITGERDPIFPPHRLEPFVERAQEEGLDVAFEVVPDLGHTLVLPAALERAVGFFGLASDD